MITLIEAKSYKCLRYVSQPLDSFHILVGPNASGKSNFLDVVALLGDMSRVGVEEAIRRRARSVTDLVWHGEGDSFELAIELSLPRPVDGFSAARYEVRIGTDGKEGVALLVENLWLVRNERRTKRFPLEQSASFPTDVPSPVAIVTPPGKHTPAGYRKVLSRHPEGRVYVRSETTDWNFSLRPPRARTGLALVPEEEDRFGASVWVRNTLLQGIQMLTLNSLLMRSPCPPDAPVTFQPDGSNLPVVVSQLKEQHPARFQGWLEHVQTVFPEIVNIEQRVREEDRHRYLLVETKTGLRLPSWGLSDGTLRFLALTLLPYLPDPAGIYLIEEPENGIHPRAIEAVYQSLSSVYKGQVLCATHSPVLLNIASAHSLLCFARTASGATDIVRGDMHPRLKEWRETVTLGDLLASGVLG
jgi:predicted ATPase